MVLRETEGVREMQSFSSPKNVVVIEKSNGREYAERVRKPNRYNPYKDKFLTLYFDMNKLSRTYRHNA